ncbi:MAG: M23 family metallopeptidase, partial [Legionellaceae bacterium]|nr:M23 family metallopeptidase [Legionellaceae bacterium]
MRNWIYVAIPCLLVSCGYGEYTAPIEEITRPSSVFVRPATYTVQMGDTLYSIAFQYEMDHRQLAALNHVPADYRVQAGQVLHLTSGQRPARPITIPSVPRSRPAPIVYKPPVNHFPRPSRPQAVLSKSWQFPVAGGRVVTTFSPRYARKGIDIAAAQGTIVRAVDNGKVAYAGNGLPGYGNLILLQHAQGRLTAYGHNAKLLVSVGQSVHKGQA